MKDEYHICHYYDGNQVPFMSLSELKDEDAIVLMQSLYSEETEYGKRFKDPLRYLVRRRETEAWVRSRFIEKGYKPIEQHPIYFVFGRSKWIEQQKPPSAKFSMIQIPLEWFHDDDVSFTYPDSMVSKWLSEDKPDGLYMREYHKNEGG